MIELGEGHEPPGWAGPIRVPSTVDGVTDRLLAAIALGEFLPGERLPGERELATLLRVGRGTVRAALGRLRSSGVLEVRRGRTGGTFVCTDWSAASAKAVSATLAGTDRDLEQLSDLRCLVEGMIARSAARRRRPADVEALTGALIRFENADEPAQAQRADAEIHQAVVAATGNPYMAWLSRELLRAVTSGIPIEPYTRDGHRRARLEHRELVEAIIGGRSDDAEVVATRHFQITTDAVRHALRRGASATVAEERGGQRAHR